MFFGLTFEKVIVIAIVIGLVLGPERLPAATHSLTRLVRRARDLTRSTTARVKDELGPEFDDVDWTRLDPRKYDPRRIIRDALLEDVTVAPVRPAKADAPGLGAVEAAPVPSAQDGAPGAVGANP